MSGWDQSLSFTLTIYIGKFEGSFAIFKIYKQTAAYFRVHMRKINIYMNKNK